MNPEHIAAVCARYRQALAKEAHYPEQLSWAEKKCVGLRQCPKLEHVAWMCTQLEDELAGCTEAFGPDKAHRWLGFIQGALWAMDPATIDDMRRHNTSVGSARPDDGEYEVT